MHRFQKFRDVVQESGRALAVLGLHAEVGFLVDIRVLRLQVHGLDRQAGGRAGTCPAPKEWRLSNKIGLGGVVINTGKPLYTPDVRVSEVYVPGISNALSEFDLPIFSGEEVIGVLNVESTKLDAFSEDDFAVLTAAMSQMALAILRARLFKCVEQLAITDELTGLNNRRHFFDLAEMEFSRSQRFQRPLTALMIDVDHFKNINDTYGHAAGDVALHALAQCLLKNLRSIDILGRYGGEEFVVILSETDRAAGIIAAERIRKSVSELCIPAESGGIHLTVSIGLATVEDTCPDLVTLVKCADNALLSAKDSGRNRTLIAKV